MAALLVGIVMLVVSRSFKRPEPESAERGGGRRESLFDRARLARDAAGLLRALGSRARDMLGPSYGGDPVRALYANVVGAAAGAGSPRLPAATPREHAPVLHKTAAGLIEEIDHLTSAYELARYAKKEPGSMEASALTRLRNDARTIVGAISAEGKRRAREEAERWEAAMERADEEREPESFGRSPISSPGPAGSEGRDGRAAENEDR